MAGAKKNGRVGMWVMTLLVVLLVAASLLPSPATARVDPSVGLSIRGAWLPPPTTRSLRCCDDCRCGGSRHGPPCRCHDHFDREDHCPPGCTQCIPDFQRNTFSCLDELHSCPTDCSCVSPPPRADPDSSTAATRAGAGAGGI
ncbi:hypothetical protein Taro_018345 [Colocasia esculenta]|uniref:Bowman-Birk serine protease inhibitors family domain-containing protein n=1 Tax=Colocasia esculenta TaxID=4460 RepID=A0A843UQT5_COLES|nr:hypothetical protein [Colocasia esculenta]